MTRFISLSLAVSTLGACLSLTSCETSNQASHTAIGAGIGAGAGAIAGNNIDGISTAEGAIAGALVGGLLGNVSGRKQDQIDSLQNQVNQTVINVRNSNGSMTPVVLQRNGERWQGPRGEIYDNLPSESQLQSAYGF